MKYINKNKINKISLWLVILMLSYLAAIQFFGESPDVDDYYYFFNGVDFNYTGRFEPFFVLLSIMIKWMSNEFSLFIFFLVLIGLATKFSVLSKFDNFIFSLVIYLLILFPVHELTQYRVSIAIGLLYLALYFLCIKKYKAIAFLLFFSSVLFHYSAIAFLPFVLLWRYLSVNGSIKYWQIAVGLLIIVFSKVLIVNYATGLNSTLLSDKWEEPNIFSSRNIVLFSILVIGFFNIKKIPQNIKPFLYISCYGFFLWWLFYDFPVFAHRLFEMTFFSYLIWLSFLRGWSLKICQTLFFILSIYLVYNMIYIQQFFI